MNTSINFELAKLLKEKGFDNESAHYYNEKGEMLFDAYYPSLQPTKSDVYYDNPTITEVVMWLYEKHGIWIQTCVSRYGKFYCNLLRKENTKSLDNPISWEMQVQLNDFNSPTEAYLAAIEYTLNKLI